MMGWGARGAAQSGAVAALAGGRLPGGSSAWGERSTSSRPQCARWRPVAWGLVRGWGAREAVKSRARSGWGGREERWLISILCPSSANLSCRADNPAPRG